MRGRGSQPAGCPPGTRALGSRRSLRSLHIRFVWERRRASCASRHRPPRAAHAFREAPQAAPSALPYRGPCRSTSPSSSSSSAPPESACILRDGRMCCAHRGCDIGLTLVGCRVGGTQPGAENQVRELALPVPGEKSQDRAPHPKGREASTPYQLLGMTGWPRSPTSVGRSLRSSLRETVPAEMSFTMPSTARTKLMEGTMASTSALATGH